VCAIKENFETTPEAQRQFLREARLLHVLRHPNLPQVKDYFVVAGQGQYLVMDYVEGQDLEELRCAAGGKLPESQVIPWIEQVCDALSYLHGQKPPVIHRDIKPANIKITPDGRAMLVDFGIAKTLDPLLKTTLGARAVTPGYSPLEQYGQGTTDMRTDIYALGATLYTLLSGQEPPESPKRAVRDPLLPPRQLNPGISAMTEAAVIRAIQMDPEQRFQSATQLKQALPSPQPLKPAPLPMVEEKWVTPASPIPTLYPTAVPSLSRQPFLPGTTIAPKKRSVPWGWLAGGMAGLALLVVIIVMGVGLGGLMQTNAHKTQTAAAVAAIHASTPAASLTPEPTNTQTPSRTPTLTRTPLPSRTTTPTQSPTQGLEIGSTLISPVDGMVMVYVPEGDFLMGSVAGVGSDDEQPQHTVYLDAFWIDRTEVTNAMYASCVAAGACSPPASTSSNHRSAYYGNGEYDHYPVIYVSWNNANAYCTWAGRQLPTEAEWEKAARGTDGRSYPWGEGIDCGRANFHNCVGDTSEVGSYPSGASPYGAMDMAGNVWEWVADWYDSGYYGVSPSSNPAGPTDGLYRSQRGGSWVDDSDLLQASVRLWGNPGDLNFDSGFRCALSH
jgi:eukaryotic-like serine/threonine-protein kinase